MRAIIITTLGVLAAAIAAPRAFASDEQILGDWMTPGDAARIRIADCPAQPSRLCGTIVWLKAPNQDGRPRRDLANPQPGLRTRPILGMAMLVDLEMAGPGRWTGGAIYDPATGRTYRSTASAGADGTLRVEGCRLMICQGQRWTRGH